MTNAPERIWAGNDLRRGHSVAVRGEVSFFPQTEYVRADMFTAMQARAEKAEMIINDQEGTT